MKIIYGFTVMIFGFILHWLIVTRAVIELFR